MTKIKICGITGEDEIAALNETGVDYAGFVLYEKSKRYVTVQKARQLFEKLNKGIRKVAVTVAPERALIEDIGRAGFDLLQVHGVDAAEAERIEAEGLTPRTMLVPVEYFAGERAAALLAANGMPALSGEETVCSNSKFSAIFCSHGTRGARPGPGLFLAKIVQERRNAKFI